MNPSDKTYEPLGHERKTRMKAIQKSLRRHGLKEIDRKWAPRLKAIKEMRSSLRETLKK